MHLHIDVKYLNLISSNLGFFKRKGDALWNFRCPYCGDSEKKKSKARGYVYRKEDSLFYRCHNCGYGTTFSKFLENLDAHQHKEYIKERYLSDRNVKGGKREDVLKYTPSIPKFSNKTEFSITLDSIESLPLEHWVRNYVSSRLIPPKFYKSLYFAPDFKEFVKSLDSPKWEELRSEDPRLIIPFLDKNKRLIAIQGRALLDNKVRYITIRVGGYDGPLIYGLDRVNTDAPTYVVEGPIDSMFLPNAIAAAGADLNKITKLIPNGIYIFDNEPKNKEICRIMARVMSTGQKFVIWPNIPYKDINDMVLAGKNVEKIISENTFSGLEAGLKFSFWRKA